MLAGKACRDESAKAMEILTRIAMLTARRTAMRSFAALLAALCLAAPAVAQPPAAPGAPYAVARQALLAAGWEPLRVPDADRCAPRDARCEGRPEMVACTGTGLAPCAFACAVARRRSRC
jgi:hypothetical protein